MLYKILIILPYTSYMHVKLLTAIMDIKSLYAITKNWQGDPCAPKEHLWEGLNCSYIDSNTPRIISL